MSTPPSDGSGASRGFGRFVAKARDAAQALKQEYEAGKRGDDSPAAPIWPTPSEQLAAATNLLKSIGASPTAPPDAATAEEAEAVADAMRGVDWAGVRSATADRTGDAARAARSLADQVDWSRVQPAARRVSFSLIAAVASGQVRIGGPMGSLVAKAIVDQGGLGRRVENELEREPGGDPAADVATDLAALVEAGAYVDTTARDA